MAENTQITDNQGGKDDPTWKESQPTTWNEEAKGTSGGESKAGTWNTE
jgi:hypothetical protein